MYHVWLVLRHKRREAETLSVVSEEEGTQKQENK